MDFADHIFLPTDFSEASLEAFDAAVVLSKQLGAKITLFHAFAVDNYVPPFSIDPVGYRKRIEDEMRGVLDEKLAELRRTRLGDVEDVTVQLVEANSAAPAIVEHAESAGADLIVLATQGRTGISALLIGSVAEKVVRHAHCAVLVVRPK